MERDGGENPRRRLVEAQTPGGGKRGATKGAAKNPGGFPHYNGRGPKGESARVFPRTTTTNVWGGMGSKRNGRKGHAEKNEIFFPDSEKETLDHNAQNSPSPGKKGKGGLKKFPKGD